MVLRSFLLCVLLCGCGRVGFELDAESSPPDAGALDGGDVDAGQRDGGDVDGGDLDGGALDGGALDGGDVDGGALDGGLLDGAIAPSCSRAYATVPATGLVSGDFASATVNDVGSCGGDPSADFVYAVSVDVSGTAILAATDLPGTTADTVVYVRSECAVGASELVCDDDSGMTTGSVVRTGGLAPGAYYVFVDQTESRNRHFDATIELLLPLGAACDLTSRTARCGPELACTAGRCEAAGCAVSESFAGPGTHSPAVQTTVGLPNLHAGTCGDGGIRSPERVYEVVLTAPVTSIRVTTDHPMTAYDTMMYVRSGCTGAEVACDDDSGFDVTSTLATGPLPAGTYYVFLDGFAGSAGIAQVTIEVVP